MGDDAVIKEVDVYLSKSLAENLYVLQYPTRPKGSTTTNQEILAAKIKPKQQKVELQYRLNTRSPNYNRTIGEQIAINVDHNKPETEKYFDSSKMDKHSYTSTKAVSGESRYAVGVIRNGELHITPLKAVLQMRPSFSYLDKSDAQGQVENNEEPQQEEEELVTVTFAGPSTDRAKKALEKSYKYMQQQLENEPWQHAAYYRCGSSQCKSTKSRLFCTDVSNDVSNNLFSRDEYLKSLFPEQLLQSKTYGAAEVLESITSLQNRSPTDQIREILINAKVLTFKKICELLTPSRCENVEKYLQQVAYLVQGCWVVRSNVLYKDGNSAITGIPNEALIQARDYVMYTFTNSRHIRRCDVLSVTKIPKEDVDAIISQVAKKDSSNGWEFRYPFDDDFVENHPGIVQRQKTVWEVLYKQLVRQLRIGKLGEMIGRKPIPPPPRAKDRRQMKYRESVSDDTEESGAEGANDRMDVDFSSSKRGKSMKRNFGGRKRQSSISGRSTAKPRQQSLITSDISPTFLMTLPSVEVKSEVLNHVREVLFDRYCITIDELRESLDEGGLDYIAMREDCEAILEEALQEAGAQRVKNKWPQNTQPVPLYAFTKFGTSFDQYREALLDLFTNTARSRPTYLVKKIEDERRQIISESVCKQIFEEYCTYKSGYYYLKGTISPDS